MARVYVSSTFEDLRECREKVRLILRDGEAIMPLAKPARIWPVSFAVNVDSSR